MRINNKRMNELLNPHGLEICVALATKWLIQDIEPEEGKPRTHGQISLLNLVGFDPRKLNDEQYISGEVTSVVIYKTHKANLVATIMTILDISYRRG